MSRGRVPALLDERWGAFTQGGVSIIASSVNADATPVLARAGGCRVSRDRRRVTLIFSRPSSAPLLDAIPASRVIAVAFTEPSTHVTIQLKSDDAAVVAAGARDRRLCERYVEAFAEDLEPLGFPLAFVRALASVEGRELAAVTFTPRAVFLQTPGPRAGEPICGAAPC